MNQRALFGIVLAALGILLFTAKDHTLQTGSLFAYFWPSLFMLPLGVFFHWLYFSLTGRRGAGLLIPGGILLVAGVVCQLAMLFDLWHVLWPGFMFAVSVGLFEFYWFGGRNRWLLIPINILLVMSLMFFTLLSIGALWNEFLGSRSIIAIVLVVVGILVAFSGKRSRSGEF
ncbi:hypothetical protein [Paenibacillus hamazuiensis]|uniref:hypothetical protein n=1 Tax=Paenibacillus hamazuiensis TaxID=2936508 RepID=UPI00201037EB|nr:hypothetical protein [Paenibacillus hamazuiensis]